MKPCEAAAETSSSSSFTRVQKIQRTSFCAELNLRDQICSSQEHNIPEFIRKHQCLCCCFPPKRHHFLEDDVIQELNGFYKRLTLRAEEMKTIFPRKKKLAIKRNCEFESYWWEIIHLMKHMIKTFIRWFRREEHTLDTHWTQCTT